MKMDNPAFSPQYKMLDRPFMSMDGNLLTVCFEKGSFIPDKLIEKEDVISSITEEIFTTLKNKNEVNLKFVCFFFYLLCLQKTCLFSMNGWLIFMNLK